MLKMIETLLDDGVLIFQEDLKTVQARLEQDPDMITDIIKVHGLATRNKDVVMSEYIYPTQKGLVYELATLDVEDAVRLSIAIDKLGLRSKNLTVGVAYPKEVDTYEGD